jgi:hypothetical protein
MVAGFNTRPTRSQAAGRPGVSARVSVSRSPVRTAIAVSSGEPHRCVLASATGPLPSRLACRERSFVKVDAHAVHAVLDQVMNQRVIVSGLTGHRYHDGDAAIRRNLSEQRLGMIPQESLPRFKVNHRRVPRVWLPVPAPRRGAARPAQHRPRPGHETPRARETRGPLARAGVAAV